MTNALKYIKVLVSQENSNESDEDVSNFCILSDRSRNDFNQSKFIPKLRFMSMFWFSTRIKNTALISSMSSDIE